MKRTLKELAVLIITFALLISMASCNKSTSSTVSKADSKEVVNVKLAIVAAANSPIDEACKKFAADVSEKTDGRIVVDIFAGGILGTETELKDAISLGTVQMVNLGWSLLSNKLPYSMSYIGYYELPSRDALDPFFSGDIAQGLYKRYEEATGVRVISTNWQQGQRHTLSTKSFKNLQELKGLKIRVPAGVPIDVKAWTAFGAMPTPMALSEVYSALEQGVIDAVECPVDYLYQNSFHQVAKNLMLTGHQLYNNLMAVNVKWFEGLSAEDQRIIKECADAAGEYQTELLLKSEQNYIDKMIAEGVTVIKISDAFKTELAALVAPINEAEQAKN